MVYNIPMMIKEEYMDALKAVMDGATKLFLLLAKAVGLVVAAGIAVVVIIVKASKN